MRLLSMLLVSAAAVTAQSPLTTTFANNNGGATGGAVYFALECTDPLGVSITDLDLNFGGAGGLSGSIDIYIKDGSWLPHTSPDYTLVSSGTVASSSAAGTATNVVLTTPLSLGAGCQIGVAIVNTGLATAYTTATTLPPTYSTTELELTVGGGSNTPFAGTAFQPRLVNTSIYYTSGGSCPTNPVTAVATEVGSGCGQGPVTALGSFYEYAAAGALDLAGKKLVATNTGSGFEMTLEAGAGFAVGFGSTNLNIGDDASVAVGTLGMTVGSNGWMAQGPGNSTTWAPSVPTVLNNPSTAVYSWTDLQPDVGPTGTGVYYGESGGVATATFYKVFGWGTTDENNIKIDIDTNTGDWSIEWGAVPGGPEDWLVGYSDGGSSTDPGSVDISTYEGNVSIYELAASGALDLTGQKLTATRTATGFDLSLAPGSGFAVGFGSTNLNIGDDASVAVGTLGMTVGSNGWMAQGAGNSTTWAPSVATYLNNPSTAVYSWTDLQPDAGPAGTGVYYGESGGVATATFYKVFGWGTTDENSIKIDIDTNTGDWSIEWGAVPGGPEDWLVGYSTGDCSRDPGSTDLDVATYPISLVDCLAIASADAFDPALGLQAIGRPVQGVAASAFDVTTTGIPAGALSHLGLLGLTNPDQDLTAIGIPGCSLYSDAVFLTFDILSGQTDFQWTGLNIPAGPGLNGFDFTLQSAIFGTAENTFLGLGALTSNGLECTIGDV